MDIQSIIVGAILVFIFLGLRKFSKQHEIHDLESLIEAISRWFRKPATPPIEADEIVTRTVVTPPPVRPPPDYGNIRPVLGEEKDPSEFGSEIHDFPEITAPKTRFEDFNRRLFILKPAKETTGSWRQSTTDDFPTVIFGLTVPDARKEMRRRLRPRYPVIFDAYGHWAWASAQLEQDPDFSDAMVQTYLSIPEADRPVVVSLQPGLETGYLTFSRYGFEDLTLTVANSMRFHLEACLALVLGTLIGPREQWLWFSVARMRQSVIRVHQENEAKKQANQAASYLEQQAAQAKRELEHQNRFVALWQRRISPPPLLAEKQDTETAGAARKSGEPA